MGFGISKDKQEIINSYLALCGDNNQREKEVDLDGYVLFNTIPSFDELVKRGVKLKNMVVRLAGQQNEQRRTTTTALSHMPHYPHARDVGGCRGHNFQYHRVRPKIHN
jgi:hypothetical protein